MSSCSYNRSAQSATAAPVTARVAYGIDLSATDALSPLDVLESELPVVPLPLLLVLVLDGLPMNATQVRLERSNR
jgi:hypothetical protein